MVKEKIIFWPLAAVFIVILLFGFALKGKKGQAKDNLLKEIEAVTKKEKAKKKALYDKLDFSSIEEKDSLDGYGLLLERSPFFRVKEKIAVGKREEARPLVDEPKKPSFKYKGKAMMGSRVVVIIEDLNEGKSFFLKEGDSIGKFRITQIEDDKVLLKTQDGEEIVLNSAKEEQ